MTCSVEYYRELIHLSMVYAKCKEHLREPLCESLYNLSDVINSPWMITGDFYSITDPDEKSGGKIHDIARSLPFINCIGETVT